MINHLLRFAKRRLYRIVDRIDRLTDSVRLAELNMDDLANMLGGTDKISRVLICNGQVMTVDGTEDQIKSIAALLVKRHDACVAIAVMVGYYHKRGCEDRTGDAVENLGN